MKPVAILSVGHADQIRLDSLDMRPEFRKATLNMKMACAAFTAAMEPISKIREQWQKQIALFLGTGHGEFNATLEFLKAWNEHRHARPFVFQNSLHNSTTGFLGLAEGTIAPSCTISHHHFSGEDALDMARQFLWTGACEIAAVIGVDARTGDQLPMMTHAGFPNADWGQGAGAVILATEDFCRANAITPLGYIQSIETTPNFDRPVHFVEEGFPLGRFYDSHAVEELAQKVAQHDSSPIALRKPNGGSSKIIWSNHV